MAFLNVVGSARGDGAGNSNSLLMQPRAISVCTVENPIRKTIARTQLVLPRWDERRRKQKLPESPLAPDSVAEREGFELSVLVSELLDGVCM